MDAMSAIGNEYNYRETQIGTWECVLGLETKKEIELSTYQTATNQGSKSKK